jgi:hypothetical protein
MSDLNAKGASDSQQTQDNASGDQKPGRGPSQKRRPRRPKKPKGPKQPGPSQDDPPDQKVKTDYATVLMNLTLPTPPVEAELRIIETFQAVMTGTLFHLGVLLWHIASGPEMIFEPAMYVQSLISFDGYLMCFFISLAISVKMSFIVDNLISKRLGHRSNKMNGAVYRDLGGFWTIDRGISIMQWLGIFTVSHYETIFPSYLMDAHGFLLLSWMYSVYHLVQCFAKPTSWCRNVSWRHIFHNSETSKCGVSNMDAGGATLDTWFSCFEYSAANLVGLFLRLTRMFIDVEDFRVTFAGLVGCLIVNTWNCACYVKGEMINSGADRLLVDPASGSIIDLYYFMPTRRNLARCFQVVDRDGNAVLTNFVCNGASPIDPYFELPQAAGNGRYTVNLRMGHIFSVLRDVNLGNLTRAGTVYYDPNLAGPRVGAGFNPGRCEAVLLVLAYGGMTMADENYLGKLGTMANYFHGDAVYFQDDIGGNDMDDNGLYVAFYEKSLTLLIPTVKSFCRFVRSIYVNAFMRYGLTLFKIPDPTTQGSTTQLLTSMPCYKGGQDMPYMDRISTPTDYRPSLVGSSQILTAVRKNNVGLLIAPSVIVERVCESSVLSGGTYQSAGLSFCENPACTLREFPDYNPGFQ